MFVENQTYHLAYPCVRVHLSELDHCRMNTVRCMGLLARALQAQTIPNLHKFSKSTKRSSYISRNPNNIMDHTPNTV